VTVRAAGHEAAADRPEEVASLVKNFIKGIFPSS
jgi:hypothetical protein